MERDVGGAYGINGGEEKYRLIRKPHFKYVGVNERIMLHVS
jgi:hypothetical protein